MSNMEELNDQLQVRRQKMTAMQEQGMDPFGTRFDRSHLSHEIKEEFEGYTKEQLDETPHEVIAAGWGELHPLAGFGSKGFWWPPTMFITLSRLPVLGRLFAGYGNAHRWGGYTPVLTNRGGGSRGMQKLPATYLMVYPARDEGEVEVVKEIIEASVGFATGYACGTVARPE